MIILMEGATRGLGWHIPGEWYAFFVRRRKTLQDESSEHNSAASNVTWLQIEVELFSFFSVFPSHTSVDVVVVVFVFRIGKTFSPWFSPGEIELFPPTWPRDIVGRER